MHWPFACFLAALSFFHGSEAALAYAFNPDDAGWQSALLACAWPRFCRALRRATQAGCSVGRMRPPWRWPARNTR